MEQRFEKKQEMYARHSKPPQNAIENQHPQNTQQ